LLDYLGRRLGAFEKGTRAKEIVDVDLPFSLTRKSSVESLLGAVHARQRRIKLWGRFQFDTDPELTGVLTPQNYRARPEQALLFNVEAWDINCS
jgi:hypothetical protein